MATVMRRSPLAAVSAAGPGLFKGPVIGDLALNRAEVKTRLAGVPVYTVANSRNEFVLVSGDKAASEVSRLGLFFFNKDDAQSLIDRIGEQDGRLARDARVQTLTMDMVYDVFSRKDDSLAGVSFRFMPDKAQVRAAMAMYTQAGQSLEAFNGIPVFQAEGLFVNTDTQKYTPLFLAKEDLDAALGTAHTSRKQAQASEYADKASAYHVEYEEASKEYAEAADDKQQRRARERAERAQMNEERAREKARKVEKAAMPKVEVGCFEEVIASMERDVKGDWSSVMFIAPGSLANPQTKRK